MNRLLGNTDSPDLTKTYADTSHGAFQRMKKPFPSQATAQHSLPKANLGGVGIGDGAWGIPGPLVSVAGLKAIQEPREQAGEVRSGLPQVPLGIFCSKHTA